LLIHYTSIVVVGVVSRIPSNSFLRVFDVFLFLSFFFQFGILGNSFLRVLALFITSVVSRILSNSFLRVFEVFPPYF
jgi:hypothetical protein